MGRLSAGDACPDFSLTADDNSVVSRSSLAGRRFILYFYPRDDSPGCTSQACGLRDKLGALRAMDVETFGVSPDSIESHRAFRARHALPFRLLADVDHRVAEKFGVWVARPTSGLGAFGNERTTFVVGRDGRIDSVLAEVSPEEHAITLLRVLG